MAMLRVKIICDDGITLSFVSEGSRIADVEEAISRGIGGCVPSQGAFVSFTDVLGNRLSVSAKRVVAILVQPVDSDEEALMQAEIDIRRIHSE